MEEEKQVSKKGKFLAKVISLLVVVGIVFCLYNYTNVLSKVFHKKYDITFVVDGKEYVQKMEYDMMPFFDGSPEKEPTKTVEYIFDNDFNKSLCLFIASFKSSSSSKLRVVANLIARSILSESSYIFILAFPTVLITFIAALPVSTN